MSVRDPPHDEPTSGLEQSCCLKKKTFKISDVDVGNENSIGKPTYVFAQARELEKQGEEKAAREENQSFLYKLCSELG